MINLNLRRYRSFHSFIMNRMVAIGACSFFDKKPAIRVEWENPTGQFCTIFLIYNHFMQNRKFPDNIVSLLSA